MNRTKQLPPDPEEMNDQRSEWVQDSLTTFSDCTNQNPNTDGWPEIVSDFLADLRHFCDRHDVDFDTALHNAQMHYQAETAPEEAYEQEEA